MSPSPVPFCYIFLQSLITVDAFSVPIILPFSLVLFTYHGAWDASLLGFVLKYIIHGHLQSTQQKSKTLATFYRIILQRWSWWFQRKWHPQRVVLFEGVAWLEQMCPCRGQAFGFPMPKLLLAWHIVASAASISRSRTLSSFCTLHTTMFPTKMITH